MGDKASLADRVTAAEATASEVLTLTGAAEIILEQGRRSGFLLGREAVHVEMLKEVGRLFLDRRDKDAVVVREVAGAVLTIENPISHQPLYDKAVAVIRAAEEGGGE